MGMTVGAPRGEEFESGSPRVLTVHCGTVLAVLSLKVEASITVCVAGCWPPTRNGSNFVLVLGHLWAQKHGVNYNKAQWTLQTHRVLVATSIGLLSTTFYYYIFAFRPLSRPHFFLHKSVCMICTCPVPTYLSLANINEEPTSREPPFPRSGAKEGWYAAR